MASTPMLIGVDLEQRRYQFEVDSVDSPALVLDSRAFHGAKAIAMQHRESVQSLVAPLRGTALRGELTCELSPGAGRSQPATALALRIERTQGLV